MAWWVSEFAEYDLNIKYQKKKDAIVPDVLSRQPDFISDKPGNKAEKLLLSFQKIDKNARHNIMAAYLQNDIILDNVKI